MKTDLLFLQRFHDGELPRAEAATVEHLLAGRDDLRQESQRMDALDQAMRAQAEVTTSVADPAAQAAAIMTRLPARTPRAQVQVSMSHVVIAAVLVAFVGLAVAVADSMAAVMRDVVPVWALATVSGICGLALLVAARPLLHIEAGIIAKLMRRRLSVGDGEVLVCRVLGVALIVGGAHIAGVWS